MTISNQTRTDLMSILETLEQRIHEITEKRDPEVISADIEAKQLNQIADHIVGIM